MTAIPQVLVRDLHFCYLQTRTRFPFRYGIAAMTAAPHLFVRSDLEIDGQPATGIASEGLPPKWFTKNPETSFEEDDLPGMQRVIGQAAEFAKGIGEPTSFFEFWRTLKRQQETWAEANSVPPLLAQLGTAMMERTVLDGLCRFLDRPLHDVVRNDRLGVRFSDVHSDFGGLKSADIFEDPPLRSVRVRHTVGLADPLTDDEIPDAERIDDGLPHSLLSNIRAYGLSHFKLKLSGDFDADRSRLADLTALFESEAPADYRITIDGNEQYESIEAFRDHYDRHRAESTTARLFDHLLFVEQPIHRDHALTDSVRIGFDQWNDAPVVIIDESDAGVGDLPRALRLGYSGTSHKNCKGIVKSLANRALLGRLRGVMSAEDLAGLGPMAMLQDLAMVALLGIDHAERNGHHYFAGLSMYPDSVQQQVLARHSDLYVAGPRGYPVLTIEQGRISTDSINAAPFGVALDWQEFTADKLSHQH